MAYTVINNYIAPVFTKGLAGYVVIHFVLYATIYNLSMVTLQVFFLGMSVSVGLCQH